MRFWITAGTTAAVLATVGCKPVETTGGSDTTAAAATAATTAAATDEGKVTAAMTAAPDSISAAATIMDWPATEGGEHRQLRAGTNGWVCYPPSPAPEGAVGQDPMCLDAEFQKWAGAWMTKKAPNLAGVGIAYMLQGDRGASISDPFAKDAASATDWVVAGPHIMVATPNTATLATLPGSPAGGVPWVMWKDTPYAHIMVAVTGKQ